MDLKVMRGDGNGDEDASSLVLTASCFLRFTLEEEKDDDVDDIDDDEEDDDDNDERMVSPSITARAYEQDRNDTHAALPDS